MKRNPRPNGARDVPVRSSFERNCKLLVYPQRFCVRTRCGPGRPALRSRTLLSWLAIAWLLAGLSGFSQTSELESNFIRPPDSVV